MPALAGLMFVPLLLACVGMLARIPPPDASDVASRSERRPMDRRERSAMVRRYAPGLLAIVGVYLLVTIARSIRADFAPELWKALGIEAVPSTFAVSEMIVALGVLVVNGLSILIVDNRRAFFASLGVAGAGALLMVCALAGLRQSWLGGFGFMVLMGLGLYLPYVAIHTTVFERLIAMTRERGNLGFLMYLADAAGYLGYSAVMVGKSYLPQRGRFPPVLFRRLVADRHPRPLGPGAGVGLLRRAVESRGVRRSHVVSRSSRALVFHGPGLPLELREFPTPDPEGSRGPGGGRRVHALRQRHPHDARPSPGAGADGPRP